MCFKQSHQLEECGLGPVVPSAVMAGELAHSRLGVRRQWVISQWVAVFRDEKEGGLFSARARGRLECVYPVHLRSIPIINPDVSIFLCQAYRPRAQEYGPDPKLFRILKRERAMRSDKAFIQMMQSRDMNRV